MRLNVHIKFDDQWRIILNEVAKQCGMSVDKYCERAVMLATKKGVEDGQREQEQRATYLEEQAARKQKEQDNGIDDTSVDNSQISDADIRTLPDTSGTVLPDSGDQGSINEGT